MIQVRVFENVFGKLIEKCDPQPQFLVDKAEYDKAQIKIAELEFQIEELKKHVLETVDTYRAF